MKMKKIITSPVKPIGNDGRFFDSYGNRVKHGTIIIIESNHNYQHFNNRPSVVKWDEIRGMYRFRFLEGDSGFLNDFWGIIKFKVKK